MFVHLNKKDYGFFVVLPLKKCYRRCRCRPRRRRYASAFVAFNALNDSDFRKGNAQIFHGHAYNYLRKYRNVGEDASVHIG